MRYFFKSDYFEYVHPTNIPKTVGMMKLDELEEAKENTNKFTYNAELFKVAQKESGGKVSDRQKGCIIVFPEVSEIQKKLLKSYIKEVFGNCIKTLNSEYSDISDPTKFWEIRDDGGHFCGEAINYKTKDRFNSNSISIYIAGCKDLTAEYIVEEALDNLYSESDRHDRRAVNKDNKIGFGKLKSFLVYNMGGKRFYEMATHENEVWHKPRRTYSGPDITCYHAELPQVSNPLTEGFDFE